MFDKIDQIDQQLFLALNFDGGPVWDVFFWIITSKIIWLPLYLLIMWMIYRKVGFKRMLIAALVIGAMIGLIDQTCNFFKDFTPSLRPSHTPELEGRVHTIFNYWGGRSGTVSAHTAISFGIAIFSALMIRNRVFAVIIMLWAVLVAYSRVYSGMHYPMDLFFGAITGMTWALLMLAAYAGIISYLDRRRERKSMQQPDEA